MIGLVAGGSGGHMFPAFSVAEEALKQGYPCTLLTDARGARFLGEHKDLFQKITILPSIKQGARYFLELHRWIRPTKVVIGFGGQMTFLPLITSKLRGRLCGIHQSDVLMGKANRWLARWVDGVFVSHEQTANCSPKAVCIGTPVRAGFESMPALEIKTFDRSSPLNILVLGGSQGAQFWSTVIPQALDLMTAEDRHCLSIVHQCRPEDEPKTYQAYEGAGLSSVSVKPFIQDMVATAERAHIVMTRAGASTLAELCAAGRPCFMVPYPHAADNHQQINAQALADQGAGWICLQSQVSPEKIALFLKDCLHKPSQLLYAGMSAQKIFPPHAARRLVQFCLSS